MDEFAELLWESGTVVIQPQNTISNTSTNSGYKHKRTADTTSFEDNLIRWPPPEDTKKLKMMMDAVPKILRFGSPEPMLDHDFSPLTDTLPTHHPDPVGERDVEADAHRVPWVDYPELGPSDRCDGELLSNINPSPVLPTSHSKSLDMQVPVDMHKSGQDDVLPLNKEPSHLPLQRDELGSGLLNFSHFKRPIVLAKASLQSAERLRSNEKASTSCNNNGPLNSVVIMPPSASQPASQPPSRPKSLLPSGYQNEALNNHPYYDSNNRNLSLSSKPVQRNGLLEKDKAKEQCAPPILATSSVCSRNVNPKHELKRKSLEEDCETHPEVCKKNNCFIFFALHANNHLIYCEQF